MKFLGLVRSIKRLFGAKTGGIVMAKADVVATGLTAIQSGVTQVYSDQLGLAYDGGFTDGVASVPVGTGGGFQQSDIDAAVKAQVDADALVLATAQKQGADALAALQSSFDALKSKDDALVVKEGAEAQTLQSLQTAKDQLAAVLASLNAIGQPAPVPTPDPVPAA